MNTLVAQQTAVLIAGGGPVGLSAGLFLQHLGVPFILVEKHAQPSILPRSRGIHVRTMELFRQVGVEDAVRAAAAAAWEQGVFGGARRGSTLLDAQPLAIAPTVEGLTRPDPSPSAFCACPQTLLEPALRGPLEARGGDVRPGCELVNFVERPDGIEATVRNADGTEATIAASYLLGAEGGRGIIRKLLGIGAATTPARQHYLNLFFRADLAASVRGRTFSQCEVANESVRGLFLSKNNTTEWSFHLKYDPATDAPMNLPDIRLVGLVRAAVGIADLPIEILGKTPWSTAVRVAERYRSGRVFLAGDAAHLMPPWGGFNGNTGIADAHNLAWKLAEVLGGGAAPDLLDIYEAERRPVAVRNGRQALLRTDFDARFGLRTEANQREWAQLQDTGALLMRHRYPAARAESVTVSNETVDRLCAQTGTRFPHAWIKQAAKRLSTLDLFGAGYVLLTGRPGPNRWARPSETGSPLKFARTLACGADFEFTEEHTDWSTLTGLSDDGAVLVRPDGFVADRSDETLWLATGTSS